MKVVVAAAGKGTRMKELGFDKPKHLLEVNGRPFLAYMLDNVRAAGLTDVVVVGGYKLEKISSFLEGYDKDITLIDQWAEVDSKKYGTTLPIEAAKDAVRGEDFLYLSGDNLYAPEDLRDLAGCGGADCVGARFSARPELYGVIRKNRKGNLDRIVEKPMREMGNQISIGAYRFTPDIVPEVEKVDASERGEYELVDAVNSLAGKKAIKVVEFKRYWFDFGQPEDIRTLEKFLDEEGFA